MTRFGGILSPSSLSGGIIAAVQASDQSSSSASLVNVTDLVWPVAANTDYLLMLQLFYETALVTTGLGLSINAPASPTLLRFGFDFATSAAVRFAAVASAADAILGTGAGPAAVTSTVGGHCILRNGANAGSLAVRFATLLALSSVTIKAGSYGLLVQI